MTTTAPPKAHAISRTHYERPGSIEYMDYTNDDGDVDAGVCEVEYACDGNALGWRFEDEDRYYRHLPFMRATYLERVEWVSKGFVDVVVGNGESDETKSFEVRVPVSVMVSLDVCMDCAESLGWGF